MSDQQVDSGKRTWLIASGCAGVVGGAGVAERAKTAGYPERFAQAALGHNSAAIHRAYARKAQVKLPALEEYEKALKSKILDFPLLAAKSTG